MKEVFVSEWISDASVFSERWHKKLKELTAKENILDFFISKHWEEFDLEFVHLFNDSLLSKIKGIIPEKNEESLRKELITLMDLKNSLSESIDGDTSLAPEEYLRAMTDNFKRIYEILQTPEVIAIAREYEENSLEPVSKEVEDEDVNTFPPEVVSIDPDMVEEVIEIDDADDGDAEVFPAEGFEEKTEEPESPFSEDEISIHEVVTDPPVIKESPENSIQLPKPKKKTAKYDSGLHDFNPEASGPIVSLAGMRKQTSSVKNTSEIGLPQHIIFVKNVINRIEKGIAQAYEKNLVEYFANQLMNYVPSTQERAVNALSKLDHRLSMLNGEDEASFVIQSLSVRDKSAKTVHKTLESVIKAASPSFVKCKLEDISEKDTLRGPISTVTVNLTTAQRIPGFLKGAFTVEVKYLPQYLNITIEVTGVAALPPPFNENKTTMVFDWNSATLELLKTYILETFTIYLAAIR